jgi:hypothetical protein
MYAFILALLGLPVALGAFLLSRRGTGSSSSSSSSSSGGSLPHARFGYFVYTVQVGGRAGGGARYVLRQEADIACRAEPRSVVVALHADGARRSLAG